MNVENAKRILLDAQKETSLEQRSHLMEIEAAFFDFMKSDPNKGNFCRHMTGVVVSTGMFYYAITGETGQ